MLGGLPTAGGIICTSVMEKRGELLVHSTHDDSYIVVVKPSAWLLAISNEAVLGYDANMHDLEFDGERTTCRALLARGVGQMLVEQWKAQSLPVFKEMHVLRNLAHGHRVAHKDVRLVVVRSPRAYAMELIHAAEEEEERKRKGGEDLITTQEEEEGAERVVQQQQNQAGSNLVPGDLDDFTRSRCMTSVMQQDVWGRDYEAYRKWFRRTYFA